MKAEIIAVLSCAIAALAWTPMPPRPPPPQRNTGKLRLASGIDFEMYCTRFAPSKAVLTVMIDGAVANHPQQQGLSQLQLSIEANVRRRLVYKLYTVPLGAAEFDLIMPSWSLLEGQVSRVSLVHAKTGEVLSGIVNAQFFVECKWPEVGGDGGGGEGGDDDRLEGLFGSGPVRPPASRPPRPQPPVVARPPANRPLTPQPAPVVDAIESDWF